MALLWLAFFVLGAIHFFLINLTADKHPFFPAFPAPRTNFGLINFPTGSFFLRIRSLVEEMILSSGKRF